MVNNLLISVSCPDKVGLLSALAGRLFDLGGDLGDTSLAVLGETAEFTAICAFPDDLDAVTVGGELRQLPELRNASLEVRPYERNPMPRHHAPVTHRVECEGVNRPGLIARLSEIFQDCGANIVRLNADRQDRMGEHHYLISVAVAIPDDRADACLATLANTAGQLGQIFRWHVVDQGL